MEVCTGKKPGKKDAGKDSSNKKSRETSAWRVTVKVGRSPGRGWKKGNAHHYRRGGSAT